MTQRMFAVILAILFLSTPVGAFDHEYKRYAEILKICVKEGSVDYVLLKENRKGLDEYIQSLSAVPFEEYNKWSKSEQLAFWINAYNGWILQIVIDHYPMEKRLIRMGFPGNSVQQIAGVWDNITIHAAGQEVSLNMIEQRILRPIFREPRTHFALVCAAGGCPALRSEPYLPAGIDSQLEDAARNFVRDPAKVRLDHAKKKIEISSIFDWFADDFSSFADEDWKKNYSGHTAGPVAFLFRYLSSEDVEWLRNGQVDVKYVSYDWSLNESKK